MQINFPERGDVLYAAGPEGPLHFVTAPLDAAFVLQPGPVSVGQPYELRDHAGTTLVYLLTEIHIPCDEPARGLGKLIGVRHVEPNVISLDDHNAKVSASIDTAFEAGRQVERQEVEEALEATLEEAIDYFDEPADVTVTFADGDQLVVEGALGVIEEGGNLAVVNSDDQFVGINPSWRAFTVAEIAEDDDTELCPVDEASGYAPAEESVQKGVADECACGVCEAARESVSPTAGFVPTHLVFVAR